MLRIFYGLSNILGVVFVLGMVGYLTFTEHWWYLGVYVGGLILAKLIALLLRLLLYPLYRLSNGIPTFAEIKVQRIVGSLMVLVGTVLFLCLKKDRFHKQDWNNIQNDNYHWTTRFNDCTRLSGRWIISWWPYFKYLFNVLRHSSSRMVS